MTSVSVTLTPETEKKLREKAGAAGVSLEVYLQRLADKEASNGAVAKTPPTFEEMTEPFARAVEATGMSEEEVADFFAASVEAHRAGKRAVK